MIIASLMVLTTTIGFGLCGPRLTRSLPPATAVRLLVPTSLAMSVALWFVLAVAAFTWIGQDAEIAALGPWSAQILRTLSPIPPAAAMAALVVLVSVAVHASVVVTRRTRALVDVHRLCGRLGTPGALVVLDTDTPDAFTTPEATGRIIITRGMLHALPAEEQAALLAHERSHLLHRHAWWTLAADLAAAANPPLTATSRAIRQAAERWADEDAADVLADRPLVARAVARAALVGHAHRAAPSSVTAGTGGDVPARVRALLTPPTTHHRRALTVLAVLLTALTVATAVVEHQGERLFERAQTAAAAHR
ncbi:M48 family metalloprotease [Micromonospora deserti]|uniref:Peptidase M48 n=1 Tax=Micromonospora deserti TaxID=2070366 RepID=A0A2W2CTL1_9ACTN|nr:M48 family metalloprotease [Micromonospora deserti]PZG02952.1 peptidase M48 [Micromonospora deserti]